ncbi:MAG: ATP-binding protein [Candidatus Methanomethyliaceae archaeon]
MSFHKAKELLARILESNCPAEDLEGETVEFKTHLTLDEKFLNLVVAFANQQGGIILIGVDGRKQAKEALLGIKADECNCEDIKSYVWRNTVPNLSVDVQILSFQGLHFLEIQVPKKEKPVATSSGTCKIRKGRQIHPYFPTIVGEESAEGKTGEEAEPSRGWLIRITPVERLSKQFTHTECENLVEKLQVRTMIRIPGGSWTFLYPIFPKQEKFRERITRRATGISYDFTLPREGEENWGDYVNGHGIKTGTHWVPDPNLRDECWHFALDGFFKHTLAHQDSLQKQRIEEFLSLWPDYPTDILFSSSDLFVEHIMLIWVSAFEFGRRLGKELSCRYSVTIRLQNLETRRLFRVAPESVTTTPTSRGFRVSWKNLSGRTCAAPDWNSGEILVEDENLGSAQLLKFFSLLGWDTDKESVLEIQKRIRIE